MMSRLLSPTAKQTAAIAAVLICLAGGLPLVFGYNGPNLEKRQPYLGACDIGSFSGFLLPTDWAAIQADPTLDTIDVWSKRFHADVGGVINDMIEPSSTSAACDGDPNANLPSGLARIAEKLPPWKKPGGTYTLGREDTGAVLQEYTRVYECALTVRRFFSESEVFNELLVKKNPSGGLSLTSIFAGPTLVLEESLDQRRKIDNELLTVRPTIERALSLAIGKSRFGELESQIACLQRASLDLRNGAALGAEAATQLIRTLNVKDPLRDYDDRSNP